MRSVKRNLSAGRTVLFSILMFLIMVVGSLASAPVFALPPVENTQCILGQPGAPNGLNCTANDIQLSSPTVTITDDCDFPGDTATLQVLVDVTNTAQTRYNVGVWLSVDGDPNGDGSETGICSVLTIPIYEQDNTTQILDVAGEWVSRDGNMCGDVKNQPIPNPVPVTNPDADIRDVDMGTVTLLCNDSDGDGLLNVPLIIAWDNQAGNVNSCSVSTDALPGTASKCFANQDLNIEVPVPARLIVNKDTVPDDPTSFGFNLSGPDSGIVGGFDGSHDFNLADNGQFDSGSGVFTGGLPAASYTLVENPTAGWQGVGTCSSDVDGLNTDPASLDLRPGETVTCDFVNSPTTGFLTVRKTTTGGTTGSFDFSVVGSVSGEIATPTIDTSVMNPNDSAAYEVDIAETYTVTETPEAGFILSSAVCTNINDDPVGTPNLQAGTVSGITVLPADDITCAFTNGPAGSIGVTKISVGGNDTFGFNTDVPITDPDGDFEIMTVNGLGSLATPPTSSGTYTATETMIPAGWRFESAVCLDENGVNVSTGNDPALGVEFVHDGALATNCTVTNVKLGTIVIEKVTNPAGNVTDSFGFTSDAPGAGNDVFSLMDGQSKTIIDVPVDADPAVTTAYSVSEDQAAGFDLTGLTCVSSRGDALSTGSTQTRTASINIRAGETVTCTFTNTERATITVEKQISGTNPNGLDTTFPFSADFTADFDLMPAVGVPASSTAYDVTPGLAYSITEANQNADGWSLISATCAIGGENVNLQAGTISNIVPQPGDDLTCTFINAPLGSATIVKNTIGGDGLFGFTGSLEPFNNGGAGFAILTSVSNTVDFTNQLLPNEVYDVTENFVSPNWTLTSVVCSDPTNNSFPDGTENPPADPALGALISAASDETVTCTFTNEADATLTINKVTVPASDTTTEFAFTGTGDINGSNLVGGGSVSTMAPQGTFVAAETPTAGWALTDISCSGVSAQNITIGGTAGFMDGDTDVSLNLAPGDDAECTFTNTKLGSITITKATVGDTGAFTFQGTDSNDAGIITSPFNLTTAGNPGDETVTYNGLLPGQYQFSETVPAGWVIDGTAGDIVCSGQNSSTATPGMNSVSIALADGEDVTCTFTNTKLASLALVKQVTNDNGGLAVASEWNLTATGGTNLAGDGGVAATFVALGDYVLAESAGPAGYTAGAWNCTDGSLNGATLTLAAGDVAVCTIINNDDAASLALTKVVTNDSGGTAAETDWTLNAVGPTPLSGAGGFTATPVNAGDYTLTETGGPSGYTASAWNCTGGSLNGNVLTLALGESAACSITNDDDAASLALTKVVTNNSGGAAVNTDWTLNAAGPTPLSGAGGFTATPVNAGDYTLTETGGPSGYTASAWSCTGGSLNGNVLTLALGESASCSITNDDDAATLALTKIVTNDNGGTAAETDWTLNAAGPTPLSGAGGFTATPVNAGDYTLTETGGPSGYTASVWSCTGGSLNGNVLTLAVGESASCSITNDDDAASLALTKFVTNDNGGTAAETDWTLNAAGPTPTQGAGGFAATSVDAGDYTLTESAGPAGYTAGTWQCQGGTLNGNVLTLGSGESASCSITNDDVAPGLTLVKTLTLDNGGSAAVTDWTLSATGSVDTISGVSGSPDVTSQEVSADTYVLGEANGPAGYTPGAWSCSGATSQNGNSVAIGAGQTVICTIDNDDDPAQLTLVKSVVNDDEGEAVDTEWTLSAAGPTPISGAGGVGPLEVDAGVYTLSESGGQAGYTAGDWNCGQAQLAGDELTLANGDDVTCTIINDDDPAAINLAKTVNGPATMEANGTYTVVYTITATNTGGPGKYNLVDAFSPGAGITLNTATAMYVPGTENDQSGALGTYPNFVTNEGLAPGLNESWTVTASFTVDPAQVDPVSSVCSPDAPAINTGFYNAVSGSATDADLTDNDTCTGLPQPGINLAKTVNGPATPEANGTFTVVYTIVATNTAGPGSYDLVDAFSPGAGITLNTATAEYVPGTENDQSGALAAYPNFVTGEGLGAGKDESWTVKANFTVDPAQIDPVSSQCDPANPAINTGFYNAVSGSDTDRDLDDNDTCTGLPQGGLTLIKVIDESDNSTGTAVPTDFALTLTGADGVHDSGEDYISGEQPTVLVGVEYTVSEAPDQFENYIEQSIQCVDDATQAAIGQPFTLTGGQNVTCTVTNLLNEVVFDIIAEACVNDTPYVDYDVTTSEGGGSDVDITWIKNDGSEEIVQQLVNQPLVGQILWPGAAVVNGVPVAWPGWSCDAQGSNCVQINDGLVPTMKLLFEINPSATIVVSYPPATPNCVAGPRGTPLPTVPVPVDNALALLLLTLMLMATGWYMRPAVSRKL